MKCLITGAAGGIGSHLCEMLIARGHDVVGLDNFSVGQFRAPYITRWDIAKDRPASGRYDWIFHLAALADIVPSIRHPVQYHTANVTGTVRMLEFARWNRAKRFIYAASSSCYGDRPPTPTTESAPIVCRYPYALTKYLGEQYALHYATTYGLPVLSLRLFNVYGPRFRTSGTYGAVFGVFLSQIANGRPCTVVGDGTQRRDFTYVSDVCQALIAAAEAPESSCGQSYNVGTGYPRSINELVHLLGAGDNVVHIPWRPGEPAVTQADISRTTKAMLWAPAVTLEQGTAIMRELIPEFKTAPLWTPELIAEATKQWNQYLGDS